MKFTEKKPTTDGVFWWKQVEADVPIVVQLKWFTWPGDKAGPDYLKDQINDITPEDSGGLWCRLVPVEEVSEAWREGRESGLRQPETLVSNWNESRSKRVVEGLE